MRVRRRAAVIAACVGAILALMIPAEVHAEGRVALVIGNGNYQTRTVSPLRNPPNDARDVSRELQRIGFEVTTIIDGTREEMAIAINQFGRSVRRAEVGLFYYAGHGVQVDGSNYLIPVDADLPSAAVVPFRTIAADEVLALMAEAESEVNLFFLDACRDNPLPQVSRTLTRGLAPVGRRPPDTLIVFATGPNDVAEDGTGRNSPFTQAFLNHIATPDQDVFDLYRNITADVYEMTGGRQRPEQMGSFSRRFNLAGVTGVTPAPTVRPGFQVEQTTGSIRVTVATAGTVFLDGERIGDLRAGQSATLSDVETGSRRLEIRYENGETENTTVTVRDGATATARFSFVVRAEPEVYRVGDRGPAGGIVFYDKGNSSGGWRYLEAWTADEEGTYQWKTARTSTPGTSTAIGSGYQNTYTAMSGTQHPAAQVARNASHGGFNDWFLPSKDELNLMYQHRRVIGGFASDRYWSSSEGNSYTAWHQYFVSGYQYSISKNIIGRVRAVRAFNP